ncbi:MAG: glycoside hydrolase family 3 protein [Clostridia bacterium]|nr:glycoside hydrolase family 3 protein [Clostridia bacterium]
MRKSICVVLSLLMILTTFSGCRFGYDVDPDIEKVVVKEVFNPQNAAANDEVINKLISKMSLEEKVGQVFMISLRYIRNGKAVKVVKDDVREIIQKYHLGGIILFAENISEIPQTKKLIADMQDTSKYPLFISIDEESGATSRLNNKLLLHSTNLPKNSVLGSTQDPLLAKKIAKLIAREISSLGFNMDLAPVADVNTNPKNPVIGERSFGADPQLVSKMVLAQMEGMEEENIIPVLKHFPGHGDTAFDSHTGAVSIEHDRDRMDKVELYPFKKGVEAGADAVMTAHIKVPKVTKDDLPATLSKKLLTDILRKEMKFDGLILTDAMEMGAIRNYWEADEAAIMAFEAGADVILCPASKDAFDGFLEAIETGRISKERLDESVKRILLAKFKYGILERKTSTLDAEKILGCKEHTDIVKEVHAKATIK